MKIDDFRFWHFSDLARQLPLVRIRIYCGHSEGFPEAREDFPDGTGSFPVWCFQIPCSSK